MDTPSLIRITSELPNDEVITSFLPPLLGPLQKENGEFSYKYYNILELENCSLNNHTISKEKGKLSICHYYRESDEDNSPDYSNQYIDIDSPKKLSQLRPEGEPQKGIKWINMNHYQISALINERWNELFGDDLFTFNSNSRRYTVLIPPGIGVYLCHPIVWGILGIWDEDKVEKYVVPSSETKKFHGSLGKSISGYCNYSSVADYTLTGNKVTLATPAIKFTEIVEGIKNDSNPIRSTWLYGVITFAISKEEYTSFYTKEIDINLIPCSTDFMTSLQESIIDYSGLIKEFSYLQETGDSIEKIISQVEVVADSKNQMIIKMDYDFSKHNIILQISFNTVLAKYIGVDELFVSSSTTIINPYNQNSLIQKNIFKYPYYLVLASTDFTHDLDTSVINNKNYSIIAVIHSENKFTTTQQLIKIRPSRFNRLVLKVLNNELEPVTERVSCEFLFRFKREFLEENTSLYKFYSSQYGSTCD